MPALMADDWFQMIESARMDLLADSITHRVDGVYIEFVASNGDTDYTWHLPMMLLCALNTSTAITTITDAFRKQFRVVAC